MMTLLLNNGMQVMVSESDYHSVSQHSWYWNGRYVRADIKKDDTTAKVYLHTFIMCPDKGQVVDHINGNSLDNRRENLRVCTQSQNLANSRKRKNCSSLYKGVSWNKKNRKWVAYINADKSRVPLGYFRSEQEAARAYDAKALEVFGEYAKLNFAGGVP